MNNDIEDTLRELYDRLGAGTELDSEFAVMLERDAELNDAYLEWCQANSYRPRNGYREFVDQLAEQRDSVWDVYGEFDS
ncbi:MAG: hypothetical protein IJU62_00065 [Muribaculaceae bacterium]|nr:hypothetical protein [Muribaculaceae bacterium]